LRIAVELGLAGLLPFLAIFFLVIRASLDLYRRSQPGGLFGRELVLTFWQVTLAFLMCINFVDPSSDEFLPGFWLAVAAVIVRRAELAHDPPAAAATGTTFGVPR
jgi:O-antigen ligase